MGAARVILALSLPANAAGGSAYFSRSRTPANSTMASVKPSAAEKPYRTDSMKE